MPMKNPLHPGRVVRQDCLEPLGLSVTKAAEILNASRQALNNLVNEKAGISLEMAIRLSKAFGGNSGNMVADANDNKCRISCCCGVKILDCILPNREYFF